MSGKRRGHSLPFSSDPPQKLPYEDWLVVEGVLRAPAASARNCARSSRCAARRLAEAILYPPKEMAKEIC